MSTVKSQLLPVKSLSELSDDKQAFVLGMVQKNVFPTGHDLSRTHPWIGSTPKGAISLFGMGYARMQHLEQHGFADQVQAGRDAGDAHWQSWSANAVSSLMDADVEDESAIGAPAP
jgi:hypothetical protein